MTPGARRAPASRLPATILLGALWLLCALGLVATPAFGLPADLALSQYQRRTWSLPDGLPAVALAQLAQAPDGHLWIATAEGLVRFDGAEMTVFDRANTPAMGFSETRSVVVDPAGDVWVAVAFSGVMRCRNGVDCTAIGPPGEDFRRLALDPNGVVWASGNGIWHFADGQPHRLPTLDAAVPLQNSLAFDGNGRLWIGGDRGEIVLADPRGDGRVFASWQALGWRNGSVRVEVDIDGTLVITTGSEVRRCQPNDPRQCSLLAEIRHPTRHRRDRDGNLWIGSQDGDGLLRLGADGQASRLSTEMLPGRRVVDLLEDREGNLWVATWDGGLMRLAAGAFATFGRPEGLPVDAVRVVLEDAAGRLFAGTDAGLIERRDDGWRLWPSPFARADQPAWVLALAAPPDGALFAGTLAGLFERRGEQLVRVALGRADGALYGLHAEPDGRVWASASFGYPTETWELAPPTARAPRPDDAGSLPAAPAARHKTLRADVPDLAYDLARDHAGRLWAATRIGAVREDPSGRLQPFPLPTALERDVLFSVDVDSRGDVWLGGLDRGLTRVRPDGSAHTFTTRDGLVNDSVHVVLEDDLGFLWVSSSKGAYRFAPADVDRYLAGELDHLPTLVFDESDGLRTRALAGGSQPAGWKARDGKLWFTTNRGLARVDPRRLPTLDPPPVHLTSVRTDGGARNPHDSLSLPPGRHRLEVHWSAVHLRAPEKVRFRYRLHGADDPWTAVGSRRTLELASLGAGRHRLVIAASLDGEQWGTPATLRIDVAPFLWQHGWFWTLAVAVAGAVVVGLVRLRLARAAERERETRRELEALVTFGREVTGLLDPEAIGHRLLAALGHRFGPVATLVLAHREGREPLAAGTALATLDAAAQAHLLAAAGSFDRPRRLVAAATGGPHRAASMPGEPPLAETAITTLLGAGLALVAPIASGETPVGLLAVGPLANQRPYSARDLAHVSGLAAHVAAALEGAWQAQEALRWRELSEARREWSEQDLIGRLVFAAVTRGGFAGAITEQAVAGLLATSTGGEIRLDEAGIARAVERLCATGVLERQADGGLAVTRLRWLLLPEVRQPLAELARGASRTVGAYRLQERIGLGGMAEVYRAVNVHDGSPAAIKLLRPDEAREEEARRRLEREGELVGGIHHPNLVRLLARGEHEGRLYLAMELLAGETLAARLRRGPLGVGAVVQVGRDVASALAALHQRGVVHRDVKPANVMAEPDGRYVLLDLGLARGLGATTLTQAESVLGTLRYMAPEALRGEPLGPASDLWSLGVTLHELATGGFPWPGTDTLQVALELARTTEPPRLTCGPAMPSGLVELLTRLLDPELARRCANAAAVADALAAIAAEAELPTAGSASEETLAATSGSHPAGTPPPA